MITTRNLWGVVAVLAAIVIVLAAGRQEGVSAMHEFDGYRSRITTSVLPAFSSKVTVEICPASPASSLLHTSRESGTTSR